MNRKGGIISKTYPLVAGGVFLYGFTLPLSKSVSSIVMGIIACAAIGMAVVDKEFRTSVARSLRQPLSLPFILFIGVLCLGLLYSQDPREGFSVIKQSANLFFVYFMVAVLLDAGNRGERGDFFAQTTLFSFLMGVLVLDVIAFLTYGGAIGNKRLLLPVTPLKMHHIWFGNLNAIGLLGAASLLLPSGHRKPVHITALWLFVPVAVVSMVLSTSRTAWLGALCAGVALLYFLMKSKRNFLLLSVAIFAGCILSYVTIDIVRTRVHQVYLFLSGQPDISLDARVTMWKASLSMFLSNPLFGVGTGDYKLLISQYVASGHSPEIVGKFNQPHNMYLFALATNGILGLSALLYLFYRVTRNARALMRKGYRVPGVLAMTVSIHFLVAGLTESVFNIHVLISSFALLMGLSQRVSCLQKPDA